MLPEVGAYVMVIASNVTVFVGPALCSASGHFPLAMFADFYSWARLVLQLANKTWSGQSESDVRVRELLRSPQYLRVLKESTN